MDKKYLERTLLSTMPTIALRDAESGQCVVRFLTLSRVSMQQAKRGYALVKYRGELKLFGVDLPHPDVQTLAVVPYVVERIKEECGYEVQLLAYGQRLHVLPVEGRTALYLGETIIGYYEDSKVQYTLPMDATGHCDVAVQELITELLLTQPCDFTEPKVTIELKVSDVFNSHTFVGGSKALQVRNALALDEFLNLPYQRVSIVFETPVAFTTSFFITLLDGLVRKEETVSQFLQRVHFVGVHPWLEHLHTALDELKVRTLRDEA